MDRRGKTESGLDRRVRYIWALSRNEDQRRGQQLSDWARGLESGRREYGLITTLLTTFSPMVSKPYRDVSGGFYQALTYGNCAPRSSRTTRIATRI